MAARRCPRAFGLPPRPQPWMLLTCRSPASCLSGAQNNLVGLASQARHYAVPRAPRSGPSYSDVFTLREIPLASFERVISRNGDVFKRLSPGQYYDCAQRFSRAISQGSSPWAVSLGGKEPVPAAILHDVACIMRQMQGPRSADAFATAMWASASEQGYCPSTLSLARQLIHSGAYGRLPQLRKVETRFKQLAAAGNDADALTAEGEALYRQGRLDAAVATLQRALRIRPGAFEWRPSCELCLARAFLKLGRREEARGAFEALSESDLVEADAELSMMLRTSDRDKAAQHAYAAACGGRRDMFSHLAEMALEGASSATAKDNRRWATEWSRLADAGADH